MPSTYPPHAFPIRVPSDVLEALGEFTGHFWSDSLSLEPHICDAIRAYMKPAPPPQQPQQQPPAAQSEAGYQWKELFLPEGTKLRASFGGKHYFAVVEGDEIRYGEHALSPSCFANLQGSGNRNAWKAVWLRLPDSDQWLLADVCRSARQAAITRLFESGAQAASQPDQKQPPLRRTGAGGIDGGGRARSAQQPEAVQTAQRQTGGRPAGGWETAHGDGAQRKNGAKRSARRKRRAKSQQAQGQQ